jgi:4-hydroxy-4-methyl-2-oxoglutarate aldolase
MIGLEPDVIASARRLGAATLHEAAGRIGALPSAIKPVALGMRVAGTAFTVDCAAVDNLWIHRALYRAEPGDVLVVAPRPGPEAGYWGDILNEAAIARSLAGLVIDGGVRDSAGLRQSGFPVFSNTICIRGTGKDHGAIAALQCPLRIGEVIVQPGDLIVGDADGVVALPAARARAIVKAGLLREADEADKIEKLRAGARSLDIYGFGEG